MKASEPVLAPVAQVPLREMAMDIVPYSKERDELFRQWENVPCTYCGIGVGGATLRFLDKRKCCKCCLQAYINHAAKWPVANECECKAHCMATMRPYYAKKPVRSDRRQAILAKRKELKREAKKAGLHLAPSGL